VPNVTVRRFAISFESI